MCHRIKVQSPDKVLSEGKHNGFEWLVVHNGMGFRCGYIKVEPNHPWYRKHYDDIQCDVHGGLTFADADVPCDQGGPDDGWWVGFDAGHYMDGADPTLPRNELKLPDSIADGWFKVCDGEIKTTEYMENECKQLADQAASALSANGTNQPCSAEPEVKPEPSSATSSEVEWQRTTAPGEKQ